MATKAYNTQNQDRKWYVLNAENVILGRLSTIAADILRGKNKPTFTPNFDCGDNVVVLNAAKVMLSTEAKNESKLYFRHSGYPGGIKKETFKEAKIKHPERIIENSIKGMMPKTKLGVSQLKRLKIYAGDVHPHTQDLIEVNLTDINTKRGDK